MSSGDRILLSSSAITENHTRKKFDGRQRGARRALATPQVFKTAPVIPTTNAVLAVTCKNTDQHRHFARSTRVVQAPMHGEAPGRFSNVDTPNEVGGETRGEEHLQGQGRQGVRERHSLVLPPLLLPSELRDQPLCLGEDSLGTFQARAKSLRFSRSTPKVFSMTVVQRQVSLFLARGACFA